MEFALAAIVVSVLLQGYVFHMRRRRAQPIPVRVVPVRRDDPRRIAHGSDL